MADAHVTIQVTGAAASVNVNVNPASLQGPKGDAFTYEDFTPEQLEGLRGPQGIQGEKGEKGDAFEYSDFTPEQLEGLRGPQGEVGPAGAKGDTGQPGQTGEPGPQGETGEAGVGIADVIIEEILRPSPGVGGHKMTVVLTDGRQYSFDVDDGKNGSTGPRGEGITEIKLAGAGVDQYGRHYQIIEIWWMFTSDAGSQPTVTMYTVYDGKDGEDAVVVQEVEETGTDAVSGAAVAAYVAEKIGSAVVEESDPTVPDWAKAEEKPTYTAEEVGALPVTGGTLRGDINIVTVNKIDPNVNDHGFISISATDLSMGYMKIDHYTQGSPVFDTNRIKQTHENTTLNKPLAFANDTAKTTTRTNLDVYSKSEVDGKIPDVSNFITKAVDDLTNYYKKSETYTRTEIDQKVSAIPKFSISVVSSLPTTGISETTIYLLRDGSDGNLYTEYIYVSGAWEILGSQRVDLTGYATEAWVGTQLAGYQPKGDYQPAGDYALKSELPSVPTQLSELAQDATHRLTTDEEKAAWNAKVKTVNGTAPDANGNVQIEAGGGVTSWNDLQDRPFGDVYGDTLTWDGNTEGLICAEGFPLYKLSDAIVTMSDLKGGFSFVIGGEESFIDAETAQGLFAEDGFAFMELIAFVPYDSYEIEGLVFPSAGTYLISDSGMFVSRLTIEGYGKFVESITIDAKYLPDMGWVKNIKLYASKVNGINRFYKDMGLTEMLTDADLRTLAFEGSYVLIYQGDNTSPAVALIPTAHQIAYYHVETDNESTNVVLTYGYTAEYTPTT